tara:strand:+ start:16812 stop:17249 length:438 start_codon:yes stop_codon:yes gene_type:complete
MSNSATEITNLLYRYAELMDAGELEGAAELFSHARIKTQGGVLDNLQLLAQWQKVVRIHPCGTPLSKHVITNPIVTVDEAGDRATCRSYYTVLQATATLPLQVIAAGRYHDEFERENGIWRFSFRDYSMLDLKGDLSHHLTLIFA